MSTDAYSMHVYKNSGHRDNILSLIVNITLFYHEIQTIAFVLQFHQRGGIRITLGNTLPKIFLIPKQMEALAS